MSFKSSSYSGGSKSGGSKSGGGSSGGGEKSPLEEAIAQVEAGGGGSQWRPTDDNGNRPVVGGSSSSYGGSSSEGGDDSYSGGDDSYSGGDDSYSVSDEKSSSLEDAVENDTTAEESTEKNETVDSKNDKDVSSSDVVETKEEPVTTVTRGVSTNSENESHNYSSVSGTDALFTSEKTDNDDWKWKTGRNPYTGYPEPIGNPNLPEAKDRNTGDLSVKVVTPKASVPESISYENQLEFYNYVNELQNQGLSYADAFDTASADYTLKSNIENRFANEDELSSLRQGSLYESMRQSQEAQEKVQNIIKDNVLTPVKNALVEGNQYADQYTNYIESNFPDYDSYDSGLQDVIDKAADQYALDVLNERQEASYVNGGYSTSPVTPTQASVESVVELPTGAKNSDSSAYYQAKKDELASYGITSSNKVTDNSIQAAYTASKGEQAGEAYNPYEINHFTNTMENGEEFRRYYDGYGSTEGMDIYDYTKANGQTYFIQDANGLPVFSSDGNVLLNDDGTPILVAYDENGLPVSILGDRVTSPQDDATINHYNWKKDENGHMVTEDDSVYTDYINNIIDNGDETASLRFGTGDNAKTYNLVDSGQYNYPGILSNWGYGNDPFEGLVINDDFSDLVASTQNDAVGAKTGAEHYTIDPVTGVVQFDYETPTDVEAVEMTSDEYKEKFNGFLEANPAIQNLLDRGLVTAEDIANYFFKDVVISNDKSSGYYSKRSGSRGGRGGGGGGGGGGYSSSGYSNGYSNYSAGSSDSSRLNNIMKNWTF